MGSQQHNDQSTSDKVDEALRLFEAIGSPYTRAAVLLQTLSGSVEAEASNAFGSAAEEEQQHGPSQQQTTPQQFFDQRQAVQNQATYQHPSTPFSYSNPPEQYSQGYQSSNQMYNQNFGNVGAVQPGYQGDIPYQPYQAPPVAYGYGYTAPMPQQYGYGHTAPVPQQYGFPAVPVPGPTASIPQTQSNPQARTFVPREQPQMAQLQPVSRGRAASRRALGRNSRVANADRQPRLSIPRENREEGRTFSLPTAQQPAPGFGPGQEQPVPVSPRNFSNRPVGYLGPARRGSRTVRFAPVQRQTTPDSGPESSSDNQEDEEEAPSQQPPAPDAPFVRTLVARTVEVPGTSASFVPVNPRYAVQMTVVLRALEQAGIAHRVEWPHGRTQQPLLFFTRPRAWKTMRFLNMLQINPVTGGAYTLIVGQYNRVTVVDESEGRRRMPGDPPHTQLWTYAPPAPVAEDSEQELSEAEEESPEAEPVAEPTPQPAPQPAAEQSLFVTPDPEEEPEPEPEEQPAKRRRIANQPSSNQLQQFQPEDNNLLLQGAAQMFADGDDDDWLQLQLDWEEAEMRARQRGGSSGRGQGRGREDHRGRRG